MTKLYFLVGLVVGAAAGSVVSWRLLKKRYSELADREIESVKEEFAKERKIFVEEKETEIKAKVATDKPDIMDYAKVVSKEGYTNYRKPEESTTKEDEPYIISPELFGELDDYECVTVKYYVEDGILTDDNDEMVDDPSHIIPVEGLDREDSLDVIYTRNDILKVDYEIIITLDSYDDVLAEKPYLNSARLTDE